MIPDVSLEEGTQANQEEKGTGGRFGAERIARA